MSTTSCPRCSGQVTLPVGVRNDATVRCPLCHAHYSLADALVNMPPILEVVENADEALPADWYDEPASDRAGLATPPPIADELDDWLEAEPAFDDASELEAQDGDDLDLTMDFTVEEAHEDSVVHDKDTEVEERASSASSPQGLAETIETALPLDLSGASDDELERDDPLASADDDLPLNLDDSVAGISDSTAETIEFTALPEDDEDEPKDELSFDLDEAPGPAGDDLAATIDLSSQALPDDGEISFNLDAPADDGTAATLDLGSGGLHDEAEPLELNFDADDVSEAATIEFSAESLADGDDAPIEFNLNAPPDDGGELREFEDLKVDASSEAEEIPLEVPAVAAPVFVASDEADATDKKGKKKKAKKAKAAGSKGKRSLVGTLVSVVLPAVVALPLTLYGLLWISPAYDFLGLGKMLPTAMLPAEMNKKPRQLAQTYPLPAPAAETSTFGEPAEEESDAAEENSGSGESGEHTTARMPTDDPAAGDDAEDPAPSLADDDVAMPAEEPAADPADASADDPFGAPAEEVPAADPLDDLLAEPTDVPAEEMPAEAMPAEADDDPFGAAPADTSDDPFGAPPAEPADDPFGTPPADAEDDLFAPAKDDPPAADAPVADDDPFRAPAASEEMPAEPAAGESVEDDLFAPAPETRPADGDPLADDPFAPAPEPATPEETPAPEMPETRPAADDDPFVPAPEAPAEMPAEAPQEEEADLFKPVPAVPETTPAPQPTAPSEELPNPAAQRLGPLGAAPVSPVELTGALQSTMIAGQQLMAAEATGDVAGLRKARADFYVKLYGMADAITSSQLHAEPGESHPQLAALGPMLRQQLAADPKRLNDLRVFSARWLDFPKRPNNGIALAGTVESTEQVGQLYHTKATLGSDAAAASITIVSAENPNLAVGDEIVALGSIVDNPQQQLAGYQGTDPAVVWSGMTMKVE